jgi:hypothetical protein
MSVVSSGPTALALALTLIHSAAARGSEPSPVPTIPFELDRNRIVLPVRAGDSIPLPIVLDTGMPIDGIYVFHEEFADQLGRERAQEARVGGAGSEGPSTAVLFDSTRVVVGDIEFANRLVVVSTSATTQTFPRDGVIGKTLFAAGAVEVDYDDSVIRLHPTGYRPDSTWTPISLSIRKDIPFLKVVVSVREGGESLLDVYIDLASEEAMEMLIRPDMKFLLPRSLSADRTIGTGLSGDVRGREGRVHEVRIGPYTLRDVVAEFVDAGVRSKQEGADGIIGNELLRRFNVIFDMPDGALYLRPNGAFDDPFVESGGAG